jgi:hypothetical protein
MHDGRDFIPTDCFCVLSGLRVGKPEIFDGLQSGKISPKENLPRHDAKFEYHNFREFVQTTLTVVFSSEQQTRQELQQLQTEADMAKGKPVEFSLTQKIRLVEHLLHNRHKLIRLIEFGDRFS